MEEARRLFYESLCNATPETIDRFLNMIQAEAWDVGYNASMFVERDGIAVNPYRLLTGE